MRKAFAKIHLWFSIPFGIIISVVCLSGAALVFEQDITRALNPGFYRVEVEDGAKPLTPSELVTKLRTQLPDSLRISGLQMSGDPEEAWMVSFEHLNRKTLSVNPYTGEINGWNKSYPFFQTMRKLHRWLMDVPPRKGDKTVGKTIVGVTTLVFVAILISGVVIWIPRTKKALKNRLQVSCNKGWRRFCYDSHVSLGFYTTLFLLVMALTGLTWSFTWYRTAAYSLFGGTAPKVENTPRPEYRQRDGKMPQNSPVRTDSGMPAGKKAGKGPLSIMPYGTKPQTQSARFYPTYKSVKLGTEGIEVAPNPKTDRRQTDKIQFDPQTGRLGSITYYKDAPASQTLKGWFYAFHTGSWGGMWTKVLYFLAAFIGGILPLSGYYPWYKRKFSSRRKR